MNKTTMIAISVVIILVIGGGLYRAATKAPDAPANTEGVMSMATRTLKPTKTQRPTSTPKPTTPTLDIQATERAIDLEAAQVRKEAAEAEERAAYLLASDNATQRAHENNIANIELTQVKAEAEFEGTKVAGNIAEATIQAGFIAVTERAPTLIVAMADSKARAENAGLIAISNAVSQLFGNVAVLVFFGFVIGLVVYLVKNDKKKIQQYIEDIEADHRQQLKDKDRTVTIAVTDKGGQTYYRGRLPEWLTQNQIDLASEMLDAGVPFSRPNYCDKADGKPFSQHEWNKYLIPWLLERKLITYSNPEKPNDGFNTTVRMRLLFRGASSKQVSTVAGSREETLESQPPPQDEDQPLFEAI